MRKLVLIADDDLDVLELLARQCSDLGLDVDTASNAMTALGKAEQDLPDLVILDVDMPYGNGLCVCEMMSQHEELCSIPVIMLTSSRSEATIRKCYELCAYYVLKCPDIRPRIEPLIRQLLETDSASVPSREDESTMNEICIQRPDLLETVFALLGVEEGHSLIEETMEEEHTRTDMPWVLLVEDDDDFALALQMRFTEFGAKVVRASEGTEGYRKAFVESPRAIILDYELPQGNGDYVLRRLKESPATSDIPVIVLTGRREASVERQMRNLGATEFFTKPFDWNRLRAAVDKHLDAKLKTTENPCELSV